MSWQLEYLFFVMLVALAIASLAVRDLLAAVFLLGAYSFMSAMVLAQVGAVDVGFTEAAVGAGITGIFFVMLVVRTTRRSVD